MDTHYIVWCKLGWVHRHKPRFGSVFYAEHYKECCYEFDSIELVRAACYQIQRDSTEKLEFHITKIEVVEKFSPVVTC